MDELDYEFWVVVTISLKCGNMTYHEMARKMNLDKISHDVFDFGKQYQIVSDNIELLKDTSDEEMDTISSLLGILLSISHIRNYIKDHLFFNLEEGSIVTVSYKIEKDSDSNVF